MRLLFATMFALTAIVHAQPSSTVELCERIAAPLREHYRNPSARDPLDVVASGDRPVIVDAREPIMTLPEFSTEREQSESLDRFRSRFDATEALVGAAGEQTRWGRVEIYSLPGADLHAMVETSGTALCQSFQFFLAAEGRPARLFPMLPAKGWSDGDNAICGGFGSIGYFARVEGTSAFVEFSSQRSTSRYRFRVVPATSDGWGPTCYVDLAFRSTFHATRTFVAANAGIAESSLDTAATAAVERWAMAADKEALTFGSVSAADREQVARMTTLAAALDATPMPTFGRAVTLDVGQEKLSNAAVYPFVLGAHAYAMRIGRAAIGWREFTDTLVILYTLHGDQLEPVASAIVNQQRAELSSIRVSAEPQ